MGIFQWIILIIFLGLSAIGAIALLYQLVAGHSKSGMNDKYVWGLNIIGFFSLSSIAAGALAIISVFILFSQSFLLDAGTYSTFVSISYVAFAALIASQIILFTDLGKPKRVANIILHTNFRSPLTWDFLALLILTLASFIFMFDIIPILTKVGFFQSAEFFFKLWAAVTLIFSLICLAVHSLFFLARVSAGYNSKPFSTLRVFIYSFYSGSALLVLLATNSPLQPLFSTILLVFAAIVFIAAFGEYITANHEKEAGRFLIIEGIIFILLLGIKLVNLDIQIVTAVVACIVIAMLFVEKHAVVIGFQKLPTVPLPYSKFEKKTKYKPSAVEWGALLAGISFTVVISFVVFILKLYVIPVLY